jgi:hypothetical protein
MRRQVRWLPVAIGIFTWGLAGAASAQQTTKTAEVRNFEVISVDGNNIVVRSAKGTQEFAVPQDFRFTVDGKPVSVSELKPGMKGTATITTTTKVTPVTVTEVRNGEVMRASGNSVVVRTSEGIRMFTPGDLNDRDVTIMRDGRPIELAELRQGDRLTATIITSKPPTVMTAQQVKASLSSAPPAPAPAATTGKSAPPAAAPPAAAAPAPAPTTPAEKAEPAPRKLPKTASHVPLAGLLGAVSLTFGLALTVIRRWGTH